MKDSAHFGMPPPRGLPQGSACDEAGGKSSASGIHLLDTPGAYPGIDVPRSSASRCDRPQIVIEMARCWHRVLVNRPSAEGVSAARSRSPSSSIVVAYLQDATISVISPEGFAPSSGAARMAPEAAEALGHHSAVPGSDARPDRTRRALPLGGAHPRPPQAPRVAAQCAHEAVKQLEEVEAARMLVEDRSSDHG